MAKLYNLARMSTATTGTGTITLNAAVSGYLTFALAGVSNGETVAYGIKDGSASEVGTGVYTSAGTTLTRSVTKSTNSDSAISLSGGAEVYITPRKEDLLSVSETQTANTFYAGPSSGAAAAPTFRAHAAADMPAGSVLQCLQNPYTTNTNLTTELPYDDTTPTSSEGTQILSQAITCRDANSKVLCLITIWGDTDAGAWGAALFRSTTCINAFGIGTANELCLAVSHLDSPASASAQTYAVRVGPVAGNTLRMNGTSGARRFGGTSACTLTLLEIAV